MNWLHDRYCASDKWKNLMAGETLPWVLGDLQLDGPVLELGPGPGIVTEALIRYGVKDLTTLEIEPAAADGLRDRFGDRVQVTTGDAADMPLPEAAFAAVVCCTMLHHVPTAAGQDAIFRESFRVLERGGVLAGSDSRPNLRLRLFHLNDIFNPVDPSTLGRRLEAAGFGSVEVEATERRFRFRAVKV
ncbi:MAG: class I SAM-dependent methyltransferase [Acidimicrobiia bacterium]|nr:class I SAM-dependent methyltransferase [Acidimicrobiia bacterium]